MKFDEWIFQDTINTAKKAFLEKGEIYPTIRAYDRNGTVHMLLMPFGSDEDKEKILAMVKVYFAINSVEHYIIMHEAWTSIGSPESIDDPNRPKPIDDPNRKEALVVMSISRERNRIRSFEILRDEKGKPSLGGSPLQDMTGVTGLFTELLPLEGFKVNSSQKSLGESLLSFFGWKIEEVKLPEDLDG